MLACFHPRHAYADAPAADAAVNYDKRAPYPTVNLLRADQVDEAVEAGLTDGMLDRNQETLEAVGAETLRALYHDLAAPAEGE